MTSKSAQKGTRFEYSVRDMLRKYTNLEWQRCPASGALGAQFKLKGDLYVPGEKNLYTVECKHYKDDHLSSKILVNSTSPLFDWWEQSVRESKQNCNKPLLVYKYDRSKSFIMTYEIADTPEHLYLSMLNTYVYPLEQFLQEKNIKEWIK